MTAAMRRSNFIPSIATMVLGSWWRTATVERSAKTKLAWLLLGGAALLIVGLIFGATICPIGPSESGRRVGRLVSGDWSCGCWRRSTRWSTWRLSPLDVSTRCRGDELHRHGTAVSKLIEELDLEHGRRLHAAPLLQFGSQSRAALGVVFGPGGLRCQVYLPISRGASRCGLSCG